MLPVALALIAIMASLLALQQWRHQKQADAVAEALASWSESLHEQFHSRLRWIDCQHRLMRDINRFKASRDAVNRADLESSIEEARTEYYNVAPPPWSPLESATDDDLLDYAWRVYKDLLGYDLDSLVTELIKASRERLKKARAVLTGRSARTFLLIQLVATVSALLSIVAGALD